MWPGIPPQHAEDSLDFQACSMQASHFKWGSYAKKDLNNSFNLYSIGAEMVMAFVLCVTDAGMEREVMEQLVELDEVDEAFVLYGEYDVIAKVHVPELNMLDKFITQKMRSIKEVQMTSTMISI